MSGGEPRIDPSWGVGQTLEAPKVEAAPTLLEETGQQQRQTQPASPIPPAEPPTSSAGTAPVARGQKRKKKWIVVSAVFVGMVVILGGIFVASELGYLSLGIERFWGLSNQPATALGQSQAALMGLAQYQVSGQATLTLTRDEAMSVLRASFTQHVAPSGSQITTTLTWAPVPGQENRFGPLLATGQSLTIEAIATDADLYLRIPAAGDTWTKVPRSEISLQGVASFAWPEFLATLSGNVNSGKRAGGKTIDGVAAKQYQFSVSEPALFHLFAPALQLGNDALDGMATLASRSQQPITLSLNGPVSLGTDTGTVSSQLQFQSSQVAVTVPTLDQSREQPLAGWLSDHGFGASESAIGRDAIRKADLQRIAVALAEYAASQTPFGYPKTDGVVHLNESEQIRNALQLYMAEIPHDPQAPDRYYGYSSNGTNFRLTAVLENSQDSDGTEQDGLTLYVVRSQ